MPAIEIYLLLTDDDDVVKLRQKLEKMQRQMAKMTSKAKGKSYCCQLCLDLNNIRSSHFL